MSKKSKRIRNADRKPETFQRFIKITTEIFDRYLRAIASLDLELVDGGSLLYPNIALFIRTDKYYALELFGSSEVYKGLSIKTHEEPNIHKYLYQFKLEREEESTPLFSAPSNINNPVTDAGVIDLVLSGPSAIEKFEKRFAFVKPYKQGYSIIQGINVSDSLIRFTEPIKEYFFSRCTLLNTLDDAYRAKYINYMEILSSSFNMEEYRSILERRLFQGVPHTTNGFFGVHYVPNTKHQSRLLSGQFANMFLIPGIRETTIGEFLKANPSIVHQAFDCISFVYEPELAWIEGNEEYPNEKKINPDLVIERKDGFFDIVDLKTIIDTRKSITQGEHKRRRFIDDVNEGISQLHNYRDYFKYEKNRNHAFSKYKIKVQNPKLYLVVGSYDNVNDVEVREACRSERDELVVIDYDTLNSLFANGTSQDTLSNAT